VQKAVCECITWGIVASFSTGNGWGRAGHYTEAVSSEPPGPALPYGSRLIGQHPVALTNPRL